MKMGGKIFWPAAFLFFLLLGGCTVRIGSGAGSDKDGGVWKSEDGGQTWIQKAAAVTPSGKIGSIAGAQIRRMVFDPQDYDTIYLATEGNGIIYTYNGGESWQQFKQLNRGTVRAVAVDAKDKCNLYAVTENKIFSSTDCGRSWNEIYYHQNAEVILTDIVVDDYNPAVILVVTSQGEIIKSVNRGQTWISVFRVKDAVFYDLKISPQNSQIVYAATLKNGLYKTIDGGRNWTFLGEGLKSYAGSHEYKDLVTEPATEGGLILISKYGMLLSADSGRSWSVIELLPARENASVYAAAVNSQNSDEIYYATRTTLVKSVDGGRTWSSRKLPFTRAAKQIMVHPLKPNILYMGAFMPAK